MGTPEWQRRLLETLSRLESGQTETNRHLGEMNGRLERVEARLDNVLQNVVGGPVRDLQERVSRLETAVFSPPTGSSS